ncbi:MAG TPA: hypothetical protein VFB60_22710 [Ktedonobacteraceae bacterium]|nr:hypothetical protein [Ktedonobacteraceae bacterium]
MSDVTLRQKTSRVVPLQIVIILLAVGSGLVHLYRGVTMLAATNRFVGRAARPIGRPPVGGGGPSIMAFLPLPLSYLFILNFVGYIVLAGALYLPAFERYRNVIRWLLIVYAAVTIVMWFLITRGSPNLLAYIDKPAEVLLILLLLVDMRQAQQQKAA